MSKTEPRNFIDDLIEFLKAFPDFFKIRLEGKKINIVIERNEESDDTTDET